MNKFVFTSVSDAGIKSLYRFTHFDKEKYYEDLLKNVLYFPSKDQLNDPFDAQAFIDYDLCSEKELEKYLTNLLVKNGIPTNDIPKKIKEGKNRIHNHQIFENLMNNYIDAKVGILSFSAKIDNLLLWAHYAAKHSGLCIELDAQRLAEIIDKEYKTNFELVFLLKVKYQNEFPIINPCRHSIEQKTQLHFLIKSKDWEYEQEWRIILLNASRQKRELPPEIFKNIYFGLNSSDENIYMSKIILTKSNPKIGMFKAIKKKNTFGLEFKKINF